MSLQLDRYLAERAAGMSVEDASFVSGIPIGEAELHEAAIASGELEMPRACAPAHEGVSIFANSNEEGNLNMARDHENVSSASQTVTADELRLFIERIERLSEERKGIADDIADVYAEAKAQGYDKPTMRRIVKLRAMDPHHRQEAAALLESYADALGLQGALPL